MTPLLIINFKGQAVSAEQTQAIELTAPAAESVYAAGAGTAQEPESKPAVAVYVTGDMPDYQKEFLGTYLLTSFVNNGAEADGETVDSFLATVDEELSKRKTPLNDSLICELSRKFDIRYIGLASITPGPDSLFTLSARIISAKTGKSRFHSEITGPLNTMEDLESASGAIAEKIFGGGKPVFGGQPAPRPIADSTAYTADSAEVAVFNAYTDISAETGGVAAIAEEEPDSPPNIAVYVTGDVPGNEKKALGTHILAALVNSGRYNGIERADIFLAEIDKEQAMQRSGAVDDSQISKVGIQFGVKFVCIADITPALGAFQVSARIVNLETAEVAFIGQAVSPLKTIDDLVTVSDKVVRKMFNLPEPNVLFRKPIIEISIGAGGIIAGGYGGGMAWPDGTRVKMPYSAVGVYLFFDAVYAEAFFGYANGNGKWESTSADNPQDLPYMPRTYISAGLFAKYPLAFYERIKLFPLVGLYYEMSISGMLKNVNGNDYMFDGANNRPEANSLSALWLKLGAGIDFDMGKTLYLRSELIYGARAANAFEQFCADRLQSGAWAEFGQEVAVKIGVGAKF